MIRQPHRQPKQNERHDRNQNLDDAAPIARFAKARQTLRQGAQIGRGGARIGFAVRRSKSLSVLIETGRWPVPDGRSYAGIFHRKASFLCRTPNTAIGGANVAYRQCKLI